MLASNIVAAFFPPYQIVLSFTMFLPYAGEVCNPLKWWSKASDSQMLRSELELGD